VGDTALLLGFCVTVERMLCVGVYVFARVHVRGNMAVNVLKAAQQQQQQQYHRWG